jgi:hybrid cluster-associated redox disulfide protein
MNKITKEMMIKEIFVNFPEKAEELAEALSSYGVRCISCCASAWESLEEGLKGHGISDDKIDEIVNELNKIISE